MAEPMHTNFQSLLLLVNPEFVKDNMISCIKLLRGITGESLKETKDFFEQEWRPTVLGGFSSKKVDNSSNDHGSLEHVDVSPYDGPETLPPPMFLVGHTYKQLDKSVVLILGVSNPNTSHETVYTMGSDGNVVHRYNRRDFGRVTGTDHEKPDPRNLEKLS